MLKTGKLCTSEKECACKNCKGNAAIYKDGWCDGCLIDCEYNYLPISAPDCGLGYIAAAETHRPTDDGVKVKTDTGTIA